MINHLTLPSSKLFWPVKQIHLLELSVLQYGLHRYGQDEFRWICPMANEIKECFSLAKQLNYQQDWNPQPLGSKTKTQQYSKTVQMIRLCCEYLSVRCIWLYVIIASLASFIVNLHYTFAWMSRNSLLETGAISEV